MSKGRDLIDKLVTDLDISIGMAARTIAANRLQAQLENGIEIGNVAILTLLKNANPEETAGFTPGDINPIRTERPDLFSPDTPTQLDVPIDTGTIQQGTVSFDADDGAFNFIDDASVETNVVINNFSSNDTITFVNADVSDYSFVQEGTDVTLSYNYNDEALMNVIQLTGVVSSEDLAHNQEEFVAAIGFDPFAV